MEATALSTEPFGDPKEHRRIQATLRGRKRFLRAFEVTPVLDASELLETLKRLSKGRLDEVAACKSLFRFVWLVKMVGDISTTFSPEWSRGFHGLSEEDFEFLMDCWERGGRARPGF